MESSAQSIVGRYATALAVCVLLLSGCSSSPPEHAPETTVDPEPTSGASADAIRALVRDVSFDYNLVESNDDLATLCGAVFTGRVREVRDGPRFGRADDVFSDIHSVVIEITTEKVVSGDLAPGDPAYVVVYAPAGVGAEEWNTALPDGVAVVVYADRSGDAETTRPSGIEAIEWTAGRPDGAPLYTPAPQGLAVAVTGGALYWPLTDITRTGGVETALPGGPNVGNELPDDD